MILPLFCAGLTLAVGPPAPTFKITSSQISLLATPVTAFPHFAAMLLMSVDNEEAWSRPVLVGYALPDDPNSDSWSRAVLVGYVGPDPAGENAWSRPVNVGYALPDNVNDGAWSRPVNVDFDPERQNIVWSRAVSIDGAATSAISVIFENLIEGVFYTPPTVTLDLYQSDGTFFRTDTINLTNNTGTIANLNRRIYIGITQGQSTWIGKKVIIDTRAGNASVTFSHFNGDVDGDFEVGPGDFETVVANFGLAPATPEEGDVDRDGEVGPSDFEIIVANFGQFTPTP
jgi:hypothetical protein